MDPDVRVSWQERPLRVSLSEYSLIVSSTFALLYGVIIKMAEVNLKQIHDHLLEIAFEAGRMIRAANPNSITTGTKLNCMASSTTTLR